MNSTVTISKAEYEAMKQQIEDFEDVQAAMAAKTGCTLPHDFAVRVIEGEIPIRVWREYRGIKAVDLAKHAGVSAAYVSEIEHGKKPGSIEFYKAAAIALDTSVDALLV